MPRKRLSCRLWVVLGCLAGAAALLAVRAGDDRDQLTVGLQKDGRIVVPTNQILTPAGKQVTFRGRPLDLALPDDGESPVVKNMRSLEFIDMATAKIKYTLKLNEVKSPPFNANKDPIAPNGKPVEHKYPVGFSVVGLLVRGDRVYATDSENHVRVARRQKEGYEWEEPIPLFPPKVGGDVLPAGIASLAGDEAWVCSSRGNTVQLVDLASGQPEQAVRVGVAPYQICCPRPDRCYVTNWGGQPPKKDDPQALSSNT